MKKLLRVAAQYMRRAVRQRRRQIRWPLARPRAAGLSAPIIVIYLALSCSGDSQSPAIGDVTVVLATTGVDQDSDGYSLSFEGQVFSLGPNDTLLLPGLGGAQLEIGISDVASNCDLDGPIRRLLEVPSTGEGFLRFDIDCKPFGVLAFAGRRQGGRTNIFTIREDGGLLTTVSDFAVTPVVLWVNPQWSPDGARILFQDIDNLYSSNPDGSSLQRLTESHEHIGGSSWSPDGSLIAFMSRGLSNHNDLFLVTPDGNSLVNLSQSGDNEIVGPFAPPAWSPDGTTILYPTDTGILFDDQNLISISVFGGEKTTFLADGMYNNYPTWRPTGDLVAYTRPSGGSSKLYFANTAGTVIDSVVNDELPHSGPTWSPDGSVVAFTGQSGGRSFVIVATVPGSSVQVAEGYHPSWSSDGGRLAFIGVTAEDEQNLMVLNLSHRGIDVVTEGRGFEEIRSIDWKP